MSAFTISKMAGFNYHQYNQIHISPLRNYAGENRRKMEMSGQTKRESELQGRLKPYDPPRYRCSQP